LSSSSTITKSSSSGSSSSSVAPTRPLSVFYFCAFISVGISTPYLSSYLRDLGLTGSEIATVLSLFPICNLGVPLGWAWIADRTHRHERVLRVACFGSAAGVALLLRARHFPGALLALAVFALFNVGIGPVVDTLAVAMSPEGRGYGRVRMWGSFGFLVSALLGGFLLTLRGGRPADPLVPGLMFGGLTLAGLMSFRVKGHAASRLRTPHFSEVTALWRDRRFRLLLTVGTLHWMALAPYNVFFGLLLRARHLPPAVGGGAYAVGVLAEGAIMFWFTSLRRAFRLETLLCIAFAATAVRWLLVWRAHTSGALVALQAMHGLTFGLFWITGIALLNGTVPPTVRATGQALYLAAMLGVGSLIGYHATGAILDTFHDVGPAFLLAGLVELAPLAIIWRARQRLPKSEP
jgi:PPP family 3-phenylpropionic acid transporter